MGLRLYRPADHQSLIDCLIQKAPDPGNIPAWIKNAEDFLGANHFVLPTVKILRRLIFSARKQAMENVVSHINDQLARGRRTRLDGILETQNENGIFWNIRVI